MVELEKMQTMNSTVLWCLQLDQAAFCSSNFFGFNECFSGSVFKISNYIFWMWSLVLLRKQITFECTSQMILSHIFSMPMNTKLECKGHQTNVEKDLSNRGRISILSESSKIHLFINVFYIYGPNLSNNFLLTISRSLLRMSPHQQFNFSV